MTKLDLIDLIGSPSRSDQEVRGALNQYADGMTNRIRQSHGKPEFDRVTGQEMLDLDEIHEKLRQIRPQISIQIEKELREEHKGCCCD